MRTIKLFWILCLSVMFQFYTQAQVVYEHTSNKGIYHLLDELANEQWIELNTAIKPYSRIYIASKLLEAEQYSAQMNKRQRKELAFYKKGFSLEIYDELKTNPKLNPFKRAKNIGFDINPLGGFYKDSLFSFQAQFLYGYSIMSNVNGSNYFGYGGLQGYGYVGKRWGFYASLRDMHHKVPLFKKEFLTPEQGGCFKGSTTREGVDWSEMRGGVTYQWQWGEIAMVKDHFEWGNNYHGANIFSAKQPSFGQIKLKLKPASWLEFNYVHGWLVSEIVDSTNSYFTGPEGYPRYRGVFHKKWLTANMFTIRPHKGLNISIGNSVIYSDADNIAYWIPLFIYKPVDHTYNGIGSYTDGDSGQNSQLFADISLRLLKHVHLYGSVFSDEIQFSRIPKSDEHNPWSWKGGVKVQNWLLNNYAFTFEYTKTLPGAYQHRVLSTDYASNNYVLGHFLRANSDEVYTALMVKPLRGLSLQAEYFLQRKGPRIIFGEADDIVKEDFITRVAWKNQSIAFTANYEIFNHINLFAKATSSNITGEQELLELWTPAYLRGRLFTIFAGFQVGL